MEQECISVIIPIYNMEPYLERCLGSVLNSTYQNLEIICVNDGSTDASAAILDRYAAKDSRIKLLTKANGGLSSARNAGMEVATGDFIAFIDSDDWIHEEYFAWLHKAAKEYDADITLCDYVRTSDCGALSQPVRYEDHALPLAEMATVPIRKDVVWCKLYRRSAVEGVRFDEHTRIEDTDFNFHLLASHPNISAAWVNAALYAYFIRENSLVTKQSYRDRQDLAGAMLELCKSTPEPAKQFVAMEAYRNARAAQYAYTVLKDKANAKSCRKMMLECFRDIPKEKQATAVIALFPQLYRLVLRLKDPTMAAYEKQLKNGKS